MSNGFYSKKTAFGVPTALVLLMLVFFFVPFGGRGARMAVQKTENNVKDWLPSDFRETEELAWFADKFVSEQFIVATWAGCKESDQRLRMFVSKLRAEKELGPEEDPSSDLYRAQQIGAYYALFANADEKYDWGGKQEKWLSDESGKSYYITPDGRLYRWDGNPNVVSAAWRSVSRAIGSFRLEGQFVAQIGAPGTKEKPNPFWQQPRLLAAPLFKTIETGPDTVLTLAGDETSPLYVSSNQVAGQREAIARLTGTLFGPPVPSNFSWLSEDLGQLLSEEEFAALPEGWEGIWDRVVQRAVDENYDGELAKLRTADPVNQSAVWHDFFDSILVPTPERQTCVVLTLTEPARRNLGRVIGRGMLGQPKGRLFEIAEQCGVTPPPVPSTAPPPFSWMAAAQPVAEPMLHIGGPPVDNVAIDEEGTITLVRLIGYSLALGLGLSYILLRSIRLMMMVFFVGGVSAMASLSMVWWCDASIDAILLTMPSLVYVLGMAGAIHIVNYYRDAVIESGPEGAPERAISHAVMPCTLAALTTAIGLVSLCSSNILPIRKFGIFSAMGVMATLVLLYIYLPSALTIFPPKLRDIKTDGDGKSLILRFWEAVGRFILRRHWFVNAACFTAFIWLGLGLTKIKTDVQLLKLFDQKSQIISDYAWLEKNFGRLVPMELVVRFPKELQRPTEVDNESSLSLDDQKVARAQLDVLERAEAVNKIQMVLQNRFGYEGQNKVGRGMSPTTFLKSLPEVSSGVHAARIGAVRLLDRGLQDLLDSDYFAIEDDPLAEGTELWRISLRLGALNDVDYGQFVSSLREVVEPVVASYRVRRDIIDRVLEGKSERLVGRIAVLGASKPKQTVEELREFEGLTPEALRMEIFSSSLLSCLTNQTIAEGSQKWLEAEKVVGKEDKLMQLVEMVDCVVMLDSDPAFDVEMIKAKAKNFVDAESILDSIDLEQIKEHQPMDRAVALSAYPGDMDVVYTGVVPVVYKAQRTLLVSLFESVGWAFVLIAFVMMCLLSPASSIWGFFHPRNLLQSIGSGAISMIPNVFPVVIIFGIMGHSGTLVDIGSMMTASVAMGVAVDDTIHFLTWFRSGLRKGLDRRDALFVAYKHVAPAMTQTTIIGGLGLCVFALSTFTPTQRFGKLMIALLGAALVGDLIFLPALLASPLGRIFTIRKKGSNTVGSQAAGAAANDDDGGDATGQENGSATVASDVATDDGDEYRLAPEETAQETTGRNSSPTTEPEVPAPKMLRRDGPHVRRRT